MGMAVLIGKNIYNISELVRCFELNFSRVVGLRNPQLIEGFTI